MIDAHKKTALNILYILPLLAALIILVWFSFTHKLMPASYTEPLRAVTGVTADCVRIKHKTS